MTRIDAVRQLQFLRQDALAKAHPQSRLAIQELSLIHISEPTRRS